MKKQRARRNCKDNGFGRVGIVIQDTWHRNLEDWRGDSLFELNNGVGRGGADGRAVARGAGHLCPWTIVVEPTVCGRGILLGQVEASEQACTDSCCGISSSCNTEGGWRQYLSCQAAPGLQRRGQRGRPARGTKTDGPWLTTEAPEAEGSLLAEGSMAASSQLLSASMLARLERA